MKKLIASVLALLLAVCAACALAEPAEPAVEIATDVAAVPFTLTINGIAITEADLAACPVYTCVAKTVNSSGTAKEYTYTGYALADILARVGVTGDFTALEATADDGYTVGCDAELAGKPSTLLAFLRDGEPFKVGPWLAPCSSGVTGDYLKNVAELTLDADVVAPAPVAPVAPEAPETPVAPEAPALPDMQDKTGKVEFAPYAFTVNGAPVTNETLAALNIYKVTVSVTNSKGATSEVTYAGYKLKDVLAACGAAENAAVTAIANDGYESALEPAVAASEFTLVAIEKDKEVGEDGTIWIAPCEATESKAYIKLVVEIKAE